MDCICLSITDVMVYHVYRKTWCIIYSRHKTNDSICLRKHTMVYMFKHNRHNGVSCLRKTYGVYVTEDIDI